MDHYVSKYETNRNVSNILDKVRSEGKENNMIVSLRFNIVECMRGSYKKGFVGQVREFVSM